MEGAPNWRDCLPSKNMPGMWYIGIVTILQLSDLLLHEKTYQ